MSENGKLDADDFVSAPHEILTMELDPNEFPTLGEWKRALADRLVMEQFLHSHTPEPNSDMVNVTQALRGQRFLAVPHGAVGVAFIWRIKPETAQ